MIVRKPPTAVYVLAILHLVGGGLGLLGALGTGAMLAVSVSKMAAGPPPALGQPIKDPNQLTADMMRYVDAHVPGYKAEIFAAVALDLVLSILLLAAGVGLLNMRPWARTLSLVYAPLSIAYHLFGLVYGLIFVMPVTREFLQAAAQKNPQLGPAVMGGEVGGYMGVFVGAAVIIYPIVVLVIMLRPSIAAAFRGEYPPTPEEEEEPWPDRDRREDWDEPRQEGITR
jgi:hypothetical protein